MAEIANLSNLTINKLASQEQFNTARQNNKLKDNEIYLTPDGIDVTERGLASRAEGKNTVAGGRGFKVIGQGVVNASAKTGWYELSDTTGITAGMRYSVALSKSNHNPGVVTEIKGYKVYVTGYKSIDSSAEADTLDDLHNYFFLIDYPSLGDRNLGFYTHAEGENTIAFNKDSHAEGEGTRAVGKYSHAEGRNTVAGHGAHAEGSETEARGDKSHAEGNGALARGDDSHAEGNQTETGANAVGGHAEGMRSKVYATAAHAEGKDTTATNEASHAEGKNTQAAGDASHAGGFYSNANKKYAFAHGDHVTADAESQATFGTYNQTNTNAQFIVGNGTSSARSNAFEVNKNGDVHVKGKVYINGTGDAGEAVATESAVNELDLRLAVVENIVIDDEGTFVTDSEIAYGKIIPANVAPYASINKVGGLGTPQKNVVNLFPATYNISNGTMSDNDITGQYTFNADADGVITVKDTTPQGTFFEEPWASAYFPEMATVELTAGTYTINLESLDDWAPPFSLQTYINGQSYTIGGYWFDGAGETPLTFTLEEDTVLTFDFGYGCGGSYYFPAGGDAEYRYRIMLNKGTSAEAWVAPSDSNDAAVYIEQPKVTSIDIYGRNLLNYGIPRSVGGEFWPETDVTYWYYYGNISQDGLYSFNLSIDPEIGPDAENGIVEWHLPVEGVSSYGVLPAGTYSLPAPSQTNDGYVYLSVKIKMVNSNTERDLVGQGLIINEPFKIISAEVVFSPHSVSSSTMSSIPLFLVRGYSEEGDVIPYTHYKVTLPESITSREDYGLGVYHGNRLYHNYIDFERNKYVIGCLSLEIQWGETVIDVNNTSIDPELFSGEALSCSDPALTCEASRYGPASVAIIAYFEHSGDADNYIQEKYLEGNPIKVFFGTPNKQEIDISEDLKNVDTQVQVETGGTIVFTNTRKSAVPSEVEYQLNNQ